MPESWSVKSDNERFVHLQKLQRIGGGGDLEMFLTNFFLLG